MSPSQSLSPLVNNTSTTSKRSLWPFAADWWAVKAEGAQITLTNGVEERVVDDWCMSLGAVTLGYSHNSLKFYNTTSIPFLLEHQFAVELCSTLKHDAVRFFKNGSDAMSCAVRLARAFTGRRRIITFDACYHGASDTFGPMFWTQRGLLQNDYVSVLPFGSRLPNTFNDLAAVVIEPVPKGFKLPSKDWLTYLREWTAKQDCLLIADEVVLGFRHSIGGYLPTIEVKPDLCAYGKALGQGMPIAALCGRRDIMELLKSDVHFSNTNNGEMTSLMVAKRTLNTYLKEGICSTLNTLGTRLKTMFRRAGFKTSGLNSRFEVIGTNKATEYCFQNNILFAGFVSMCVAHTDEQMNKLVDTLKMWRKKQ